MVRITGPAEFSLDSPPFAVFPAVFQLRSYVSLLALSQTPLYYSSLSLIPCVPAYNSCSALGSPFLPLYIVLTNLYLLIAFPVLLLILILEYIYTLNLAVLAVLISLSSSWPYYCHSVGCARVIVGSSVTNPSFLKSTGQSTQKLSNGFANLLGLYVQMNGPCVIGESGIFCYVVSFSPSHHRRASSQHNNSLHIPSCAFSSFLFVCSFAYSLMACQSISR